jgi:hypothetical protein
MATAATVVAGSAAGSGGIVAIIIGWFRRK